MVNDKSIETIAVIQARTSSKRLPGKVLSLINGKPILEWQVWRVLQTIGPDRIVMATSDESGDDEVEAIAQKCEITTIRGSLNNVYSRFVKTIDIYEPRTVIRITGDCPFFMPKLCEAMLEEFAKRRVDYLSNILIPTYPNGCDIEIFSVEALRMLGAFELTLDELEHVTLGMYNRKNIFKCENYFNEINDSFHRWTLDTADDLDFIAKVYKKFEGRELVFTYEDIMLLLQENPTLSRYDDSRMINKGIFNV